MVVKEVSEAEELRMVNLRLPERLILRLDLLATEAGKARAQYIRDMLEELSEQEVPNAMARLRAKLEE